MRFKIGKTIIHWGKGNNLRDFAFGGICAYFGLALVSLVNLFSGFSNLWFNLSLALIFATTLLIRFQNNWDKLWKNNIAGGKLWRKN